MTSSAVEGVGLFTVRFMVLTMLTDKSGYLVLVSGIGLPRGRSHVWNGADTVCRMWSTGGLKQDQPWLVTVMPLTDVCRLCEERSRPDSTWITGCDYQEALDQFIAAGGDIKACPF